MTVLLLSVRSQYLTLRARFEGWDADSDGTIDAHEFRMEQFVICLLEVWLCDLL